MDDPVTAIPDSGIRQLHAFENKRTFNTPCITKKSKIIIRSESLLPQPQGPSKKRSLRAKTEISTKSIRNTLFSETKKEKFADFSPSTPKGGNFSDYC
mmetsp:Transcript_23040/g.20003  ORF Transcript_23040/g.20003 Transcript_23040/m.20003 type:complete len:98 (+) Transcript_23040:126-419(+)